MDSTILERRLGKVDEKIDEVTRKLEEKEKERNDASFEGRTRLDKFIDALYARLVFLNADSTRLNVALAAAAAAPAPGKDPPLALDASAPGICGGLFEGGRTRTRATPPARCRVP